MIKINSKKMMQLHKDINMLLDDVEDKNDMNDDNIHYCFNKQYNSHIITPRNDTTIKLKSLSENNDIVIFDTDKVKQFINKYKKYKNNSGKISPYEYICKNSSDQLSILLDNHNSPNKDELKQLVINKINEIQNEAKQLNISIDDFIYLDDNQIKNILFNIDTKKNIGQAVDYLYQMALENNELKRKKKRG